ncbi:hypothetical protein AZE42_07129 [Rhizopogon vesiculosus]|uniref:Uncharacterized protein n=1 Tax=Rhizopogon vesiculosus TaxID=180088 RepID=A0A1J8QA25_9AGAM|nr:hypothetical protein AZE42_07129 [Rhizopogon vesiculosus]
MFARQPTISSVIICTTALGVLFYVATILISVLQPESPFQTAESTLIRIILRKIVQFSTYLRLNTTSYFHQRHFPPVGSTSTPDEFGKSSAIRWILERSTDPEVVEVAAVMVPRVQWPPKLDASPIYARLFDTLKTCVDRPELFVTYRKAMAHLRIQSTKLNFPYFMESNVAWRAWGDRSQFIRDATMDAQLACEQRNNAEDRNAQLKHEADARTALRTMLVHGLHDYLLPPDNEHLIWNGDFRWRHSNGNTPSYEEFDWLIDYLVEKVNDETDAETEGDALLALSAMHGLGSSAKRSSYVKALTRCMAPTRPSRVRYAALRAVSDARDELASITSGSTSSDSQGVDKTLLDELSRALLGVIHPNHSQPMQDSSLVKLRDCCYLRFIFALAENDEWCKRLTRDGHVDWCISLHDKVLASSLFIDKVYLAGIILRINPSRKNNYLNPAQQQCWTLIQRAWNRFYLPLPSYSNLEPTDMNIIEALQALVTTTRQNLRNSNNRVASAELETLQRYVHNVLQNLKRTQERLSQADAPLDAALLTVQGLYNELSSYAEHRNTSQGDNRTVKS